MNIIVTGAGGFIGHHLVKRLVADGHFVRGIDIKKPEYEASPAQEFFLADLRTNVRAESSLWKKNFDRAFMLAADMGGMGYIKGHDAIITDNNLRINLNTLGVLRHCDKIRVLFTSSACIYPVHLQESSISKALRETDAYPANPEDGYGWEKLMTERMCEYYRNDHNLDTRVARFHNIYGPLGTWDGGREKAPAAMCRKVAFAKLTKADHIEIWGDGHQTRSFCYIDDCVDGLLRLMESPVIEPLNIGSDRMVTINFLARLAMQAADYQCEIRHIKGPQGVRGRNSDNTLCRRLLRWEPSLPLEDGMKRTYDWIEAQVAQSLNVQL